MTQVTTTETAKQLTRTTIADAGDRLIGLSRMIHGHPELGFEEEQASRW